MTNTSYERALVMTVEANFTGGREKELFFIGLMGVMAVRAHPRFHRLDVTAETYAGHRCAKKLSLR